MIRFLPLATAQDITLKKAQQLGLPGAGGGIIDARPHMKQLLQQLYASGLVIAQLEDGPLCQLILAKLNAGSEAKISQ